MEQYISTIIIGVLVNLISAVIIWIFIDRSIKKNDELKIKLNNERIVKSQLLGQYSNIINANFQVQYIAFNIANLRNKTISNSKEVLHNIMNDLRHIANTQWGLYELLIKLDAEEDILNPFAEFSNELAVIAISLFRNNSCSEDDLSNYSNWYKEVKDSSIIEWKNSSHWERIEILLNGLAQNCNDFSKIKEEKKLEIFCNLGEAMGHLSCLYTDGILISFEKEVNRLKISPA